MTDRELLELAAKAAGLEGFTYISDNPAYRASHTGLQDWKRWNPLTDDGDALRLAVTLRLEVNCTIPDKPTISVYGNSNGRMVACHEDRRQGDYAATRRAIVRAATEIGRQMK